VQKCLENKNVRSTENGRHERKWMNRLIMNLDAVTVCVDGKKWKKILKGGLCSDVGSPQKGNSI
jgi:hypothetical protein